MQVLIVGASGFIGRHLARRLNETLGCSVVGTFWSRAPLDNLHPWYRVDLTDGAMLERVFQLAQPDAVVHLAAMADVGTAEREPERATAVNVAGTSSVARLCYQHRAKLVFVSTEYVFGGERGFYSEDHVPSPTTHYGQTKWEAEQEVAKLDSDWSILRTSIVYGWPAPGKRNFAPWLIERLQSGQPYHVATSVYRTPVYVGHLTDGIVKLVEGDHPGVHHVAGRDWVSMHEFAMAIADGFHLDRGLVVPIDAAATGESRHPDLLGLDCAKTMHLLGLVHSGLIEGLAAMQSVSPGVEQ